MKIPVQPPSLLQLVQDDAQRGVHEESLRRVLKLLPTDIGRDRGVEYLHWERLKHKPLPDGLETHEDWWQITKLRRSSAYRHLPFESKDGRPFVYWLPDPVQKKLHQVDQQAAGRVEVAEQVANPDTRDRYLFNSLVEEAITSSQLEGASTSHRVAKAMLRAGRKPRDKSEQMIFNNYRAMTLIREEAQSALTREFLLELHRVVTDGTLEDPGQEGRFRRKGEDVVVHDIRDRTVLHVPPHCEQLEERVERLCRFANGDDDGDQFMHPVVRAILLHFMVGYDHPFVDGNGRTARALFYWSMANQGYWMMEFISISTILKRGPAKYMRAYLFTEQDENDATYFIDFNLQLILRAIKNLQKYLVTKAEQVRSVEDVLGTSVLAQSLNHRQIALLSHAIRSPGGFYTFASHGKSHRITYPTARTDLLQLVDLGLLTKMKIKKAFAFQAIPNLADRLAELKDSHA